jgi:PAS domain S-box-containing protein
MQRQQQRTPHGLIQDSLLGEVLANADLAALVIDPSGRYVAANAEACALTGYSQEEILSVHVGGLNPDTDLPQQFGEVAARRRHEGEATITHKDGDPVHIGYRAVRTTVAGVPYVLALVWRV